MSPPVSRLGNAARQSRTTQVLALSLGSGLGAVVGVLSAAVLSRLLTKGDYATYRQTFLTYTFTAPFLGLGVTQGIYYFLADDRAAFRSRLSGATLVLGLMGVLWGLFLVLGGNGLLAARFNNEALQRTSLLLLPYVPLYLMLGLLGPALVSLGCAKELATFNVISRLCVGSAIVSTCIFWRRPDASIIGNVVATCLMTLAGAWLLTRHAPAGSWLPGLKATWELITFSVPLGLASMAGATTVELGKVIVSSLCTPEEFAVYVNGATEVPLIGIITGSISSVVMVEIRRAISRGRKDEAIQLFRKIAAKAALVIFPTLFFLLLSADWFVQTLFSERYADSARPFRIYLLLLPIRVCFYGPLLVAVGRPRVVMYRAVVGLVLTALLTVVLVRQMGYLGAAVAAVFVTYAWNLGYNLWFIAREFQIPVATVLPLSDLGRIAAVTSAPAVALWGVSTFWAPGTPLLNLLTFGVAYWALMIVWWNKKLYDVSSILRNLRARIASP